MRRRHVPGFPAAGVPAAGVPAAGVPAAGVPAAGVPEDITIQPAEGEKVEVAETSIDPKLVRLAMTFLGFSTKVIPKGMLLDSLIQVILALSQTGGNTTITELYNIASRLHDKHHHAPAPKDTPPPTDSAQV